MSLFKSGIKKWNDVASEADKLMSYPGPTVNQ